LKLKTMVCIGTILLLIAAAFAYAAGEVIVEAEKFSGESGGSAQVITGRPASSAGAGIAYWDNQGHALEWEVAIPKTDQYKMTLRYAQGRGWAVYRKVEIDGAVPDPAFEKIKCVPTGGFGKDRNNWYNHTVSDANNAPVLINLTEGKHVVRITNAGADGSSASLNFDCFGFLSADADPDVLGKPGFKPKK
jgi:hypothetical protein